MTPEQCVMGHDTLTRLVALLGSKRHSNSGSHRMIGAPRPAYVSVIDENGMVQSQWSSDQYDFVEFVLTIGSETQTSLFSRNRF